MSLAEAESSFRAGDLSGSLASLQALIRSRPQDAKLRIFLAQLLMILAQWDRAQNQLNVIGELDPSALPMVHTYRAAIQCEQLRAAVFAGKRSPLIFGEPEPWVALLIQALALEPEQAPSAAELRSQAFDQAPATRGTADSQPFEWIADADSRLGPVLEVLLNGAYYWVPVSRIARISTEVPADIRDFVWLPAHFVWSNGGEAMGLMPARYPGASATTDPQLLLGRRTEWDALAADQFSGRGQRVLATADADYGLLNLREVVIAHAMA
jgi:type VI secretion system protein ImpE